MVVHSPSKTTSTPWPALLPMGALTGKPPVPIARPATLVGSRQTANLRLHSSTVSKAHALILSSENKVHIRDLNSRTKVLVNGKEVREADLREGDQVKIGRFTFRFTAGPRIQSTARRRTLPAGQLETDNGDVVPLEQRVIVIGQRAGCDLVIGSPNVSTTHAAIYDVNGRRYIMDLGSRNGTLVNNHKTIQVELKVGDVIDIGGTEIRYVGTGAAPAASQSRRDAASPKASAPAAAAPQVAEAEELLALESLSEAPAPPRPSGQSKLFELPATVPDDSDAPIPLEDELKLPEPKDVRERIEIESPEPVEAVEEEPIVPAPEPVAEKSAEDELMAMLEEEPAAREASVEPEIKLEMPEPVQEIQEPAPTAQGAVEEPVEDIEQPPEGAEEELIPVEEAAPEAPPPAMEEPTPAVAEAPEPSVAEEPISVEDEVNEAPPEPIKEQTPAIEAVEPEPVPEPADEKSAEDEIMALLEEESEAIEAKSDQEVQPEAEAVSVIEEPMPAESAAQEASIPVQEPVSEVAPAPIEELPPALAEVEPEPEPVAEAELEFAPEPVAEEGEVVGTATANVEIVPPTAEEVAEEVKEAATAFEADALPLVEDQTPVVEPEPAAAVEPVQELEPVAEVEPIAQAEPVAEPEPIAEAQTIAEPESVPPPAPQDSTEAIRLAESEVEEILEEVLEPQEEAPKAEPIAAAPVELPGPPPVEEKQAPVESEPYLPNPPRPRWITPSSIRFTPTVLTIKPPQPGDFDLDEFLGEKKTPFATGKAPIGEAPIPEAPPAVSEPLPPPLEVAPAVVEEKVLKLEPPAPVEEMKEVPAAPVEEAADSDELALAALEELAPPEAPAQAQPQVIEPPEVEEAPTIEEPPAPQEVVATTSTAIVPEPSPPSATTSTSTLAPVDEDSADLLEELHDEPQAESAASPILSAAAQPQISTPPPEIEEEQAAPDVFSLGHARPHIPQAPAAPAHRGVSSPGRIPPRPRGSAPIPPRWGPLASAVVSDGTPHAAPRRARKKLSVLLVLMLVAMVVAALVVWKIVIPRVIVQGTIRYDNTANLRGEARDAFQKQQLDLLADARVRTAAEGLFKVKKPKAAGFFVDQDFQSPQLKREWVANGDRSELQITYQGTDPTLDADRLFCLLQAIYDANSSSVSTATAATRTADQKRMALSSARADLNKLRERRMTLEAIVPPDPAALSTAQAEVAKLDQAWTDALTARKAIAADVDRLAQPAESAAAGAALDRDSALKLMSEKLTGLNGRLAEAKSAAAKQAADARKALNSSIEDFQASLGAAQGMMKDNTAVAAYISSAQKLHEASWKFQGDLIERQERQQKQLLEYKKRLEEQVEARRREVLEKDPDLRELTHLLELKAREVNALSASGGLKRDVERLRSEMTYIEGRITSRKVAVAEDKFYSDAIGGLKQIIESVQKQLDADRAASERLMNDLETRFRNTSPEIETLPAAQRTMAARLASQVDAMQAARKGYTEAMQAQDADANKRLKDLQAEAAALESEIALRRKELAAQEQKKLTEQQAAELQKKQAALADAEKTERAARDAYRQKIKEVDLLVERDRAYQSTREELQRIIRIDEPTKQDQVNAAERAEYVAARAVGAAVAPRQPEQPKILEASDHRFLYGTGAVLVVGLVFGALAFFTIHSEPKHRHEEPAAPVA